MFIGYYNKSVILTYLGVIFGVMGIYFSFNNQILMAYLSLLISGICDMFDGKVARKCKRNKKEKMFGIEIDSLADTVNFLLLPVIIYSCSNDNSWYYSIIYALYILCGITRLGYFNVDSYSSHIIKPVTYYSGLPVTTVSFIFPAFYILSFIIDKSSYLLLANILMLIISFLFVYNFKLRKATGKTLYFFLGLAIVIALVLLGFYLL